MPDDRLLAPAPTREELRSDILRHLTYSLGKDTKNASLYDWRMALSFSLRDRVMAPWFASTRATYARDLKRVYYLSMEYLIGRLLEDASINLGIEEHAEQVMSDFGVDFTALIANEPDAALGNGGLGRLAACFLDSMATLGLPSYGYGIRYENGLFRQRFEGGQQVEVAEDWLSAQHPWEFERPEVAYEIAFKGQVEHIGGRAVWKPSESVLASAWDTPIIGWQSRWANTLRLWSAKPTTLFDLERFNRGDYAAAAAPEALARTISRVLYPDDTTFAGKELRLKQEYFLVSAALQDILRRYTKEGRDPRGLASKVAIQLNDTHPALAGPELIRLLVDTHGLAFEEAAEVAVETLGYTNHTLMPEALERWSTWLMGTTLPRHMQIIERIDDWHGRNYPARKVSIVQNDEVCMGELSFIMAHRVNGVSALHSDLVKSDLFPALNEIHPDRILNETNGITPRRWLKQANAPLAGLITETIGEGWETNLDRLQQLDKLADDAGFRAAYWKAKGSNKMRLTAKLGEWTGRSVSPDAMFDVQVKRIHEYKRQLMNILEAVARWQAIHDDPKGDHVPRVKVFGGKSAPGYWVAKEIIHLINDVGLVLNNDPVTRDLLRVVYPANYNVSMAEMLIPAADLSEQISTAGAEASGTGNMKFALNGALTIGTLDGANVEIREQVGAENFFLFGMTTPEVLARRTDPQQSRKAIEASPRLQRVIREIGQGRFSQGDTQRYQGIIDRLWNHDHFMVGADFEAYCTAQAAVDQAWRDPVKWQAMAVRNTARMGFFSSDRTIRGYMADIWNAQSALN